MKRLASSRSRSGWWSPGGDSAIARHRRGPGTVLSCLACLALAAAAGAAPTLQPIDWPVRFTDVAAAAGLTHPTIYGAVDTKRFIVETNGAGVAFIDYDKDGWLDAFVLSGTELEAGTRRQKEWPRDRAPRSRLYRNRQNGTFEDVTARAGIDVVGWASSVCAGDVDNDGWTDMFVTSFGRNVLYTNAAGKRFEDATKLRGLAVQTDRWGAGCTFIDADRDGDLDLFVANYLAIDLATAAEPGENPACRWKGIPVNCGPKGLPAETNLFYRNRGDGTFEDVSTASGIARVTGRYSMTPVAVDLDEDGWTDLYVATDSTAAIHYRNNRDGTFTDVALQSGSAFNEQGLPQAGMGVAVADANGDGRFDLLKTHFADDIPALYRALGRGLYEDVAMISGLGVRTEHVQWGVGMPDLDNDGAPDALIATGHVYPEVERALPQYPHRGPRLVFANRGDGRFVDVTMRSGTGATTPHSSRGAAFGDYDNDGDVDVLVMNMNEPPSLLRNDYGGGNGWLTVQLEGRESSRTPIGAIVTITIGGRRAMRTVTSQSSYYSHDDLRLHFGTGGAARIDRLEVRWPRGGTDVLVDVPVRRSVTVVEGSSRQR